MQGVGFKAQGLELKVSDFSVSFLPFTAATLVPSCALCIGRPSGLCLHLKP